MSGLLLELPASARTSAARVCARMASMHEGAGRAAGRNQKPLRSVGQTAYEIDQLRPAVALDHFGLRDLGLNVANLERDAREPALCAAASAVRGSRAPLRSNRIAKASDALRSCVAARAERWGTESALCEERARLTHGNSSRPISSPALSTFAARRVGFQPPPFEERMTPAVPFAKGALSSLGKAWSSNSLTHPAACADTRSVS